MNILLLAIRLTHLCLLIWCYNSWITNLFLCVLFKPGIKSITYHLFLFIKNLKSILWMKCSTFLLIMSLQFTVFTIFRSCSVCSGQIHN
ncbi:hypothetical protein K7X08_032329 [Anisodus acutangulus]|uniref:Uncharacterized protein n=1 Tax=Anisodus acutangulus TaxID=402998 RepID=A0A9Q1M470_9SOLA|nr:hypothetical protein K7X08_032329 [Anisodus acutangulus]